jgi:SAM-dependent methyltransferase
MKQYLQLDVQLEDSAVNDYDRIAPVFDKAMGDDFLAAILEPTVGLLRRRRQLGEGFAHLDLACGTGSFLCAIAERFSTAGRGIDASRVQISEARKRAAQRGTDIDFKTADIVSARYSGRNALVTANFDALNHLDDTGKWRAVFEKALASLRPGGLFLFDVNTMERLRVDWHYPEVIVKPGLTYVQCGLAAQETTSYVRRRSLNQIFVHRPGAFECFEMIIEQMALPRRLIIELLKLAGFSRVWIRRVPSTVRQKHIFLKNRDFYAAVK